MKTTLRYAVASLALAALAAAADIKIDLSKEQTGKPPAAFEPVVGTWLVAQDGVILDDAVVHDGQRRVDG